MRLAARSPSARPRGAWPRLECLAAALCALACLAGAAHADVVHHVFPATAGMSAAKRRAVSAAVKAHVTAAGHTLGKKGAAVWLLATRLRKEASRYVLALRYRKKTEKDAREATGAADPAELLSVLAELLDKVLPRTGGGATGSAALPPLPAELPSALPPPEPRAKGESDLVTGVKTEGGKPVLSTWAEDQPTWKNLYTPPTKLAPFPPPIEPPPLLGDLHP